jgi:hypothetical protein
MSARYVANDDCFEDDSILPLNLVMERSFIFPQAPEHDIMLFIEDMASKTSRNPCFLTRQ